MTIDPKHMIDGYLDDTLSNEELTTFRLWLKETPENGRQFAQAMLFHDRLRGEYQARDVMAQDNRPIPIKAKSPSLRRLLRPAGALVGVVITAMLIVVVLWRGLGETPASAATAEIHRIIAANARPIDRTYRITVEEAALPPRREKRRPSPEDSRPPKPPLDNAVLHVRGGEQFVLIRTTVGGEPFITGSNGRTSWAVRPDGPVRVSSDLSRFNRDLPGHEHSMPLINIQDGLERLSQAYDVQLLPIENQAAESNPDDEPSRLMVAVKRRGYRGPQRVEITYAVRSGMIRQMRFVEMPYGPEHLTLRMTLVEERHLDANFFDHESHHAADRTVEFEK